MKYRNLVDVPKLRQLIAERGNIYQALRSPDVSIDLLAVLEMTQALLYEDVRKQVRSPSDMGDYLIARMALLGIEEMWVVLLDTKSRIQDMIVLYKGYVNGTSVRASEVFREAIKRDSAAIIVVHNHPSGDPTPSPEDVAITTKIIAAGTLLEIDVLDHIIVGQGRWISMRERGLPEKWGA